MTEHRVWLFSVPTLPVTHQWTCSCGRRGRWTVNEDKASRGGAMHRAQNKSSETETP